MMECSRITAYIRPMYISGMEAIEVAPESSIIESLESGMREDFASRYHNTVTQKNGNRSACCLVQELIFILSIPYQNAGATIVSNRLDIQRIVAGTT